MDKKKKLLLVDDSDTALMLATMILKKYPLEVITAMDGEDAIQKALEEHPDLILMDVVMPNLDGLEALEEIRCSEELRNVPIILVTTKGKPEVVEKGFELGCNDVVIKPFDSLELISKIENYIEF